MNVLFMPYPSASGTWGCTVYMLAMATEAVRRGHTVTFHACPPSACLLVDKGFSVLSFEGAEARDGDGPIRDVYDVFTALGMDDEAFWHRLHRLEMEVIDAVRPDVIVTDMRPTAVVSARAAGVPCVAMASACTHPSGQRRPERQPLDDLAAWFAERYLDPPPESFPELIFAAADRKIATSTPSFEPELREVPGLSYVGYLKTDTDSTALDCLPPVPERLVLTYLSTVGWGTSSMVTSLTRSAERVGVTMWCVTTAAGGNAAVSDHLRLFRYLPFEDLFPRSAAVLFHGGQGTAIGTLFHGVPSIACPGQHFERQYNAQRLETLGCGINASLLDLRPRVLSGLLDRAVEDPAMRERAAAAQGELLGRPGTASAVDVIEQAAQTDRASVPAR